MDILFYSKSFLFTFTLHQSWKLIVYSQGAHDAATRGSPAPDYYETFPHGQPHGQGQVRERPVEMEAITIANPLPNEGEADRASKF